MNTVINAKQLRELLPKLVERVRKGARFTVFYRSRAAFQIIPVDDTSEPGNRLEDDSLYRAGPVGTSTDNLSAQRHDEVLYR